MNPERQLEDGSGTRLRQENDSLLGWGRSSDNRSKRSSGVGHAKYTEGPLGGYSRSRMATFDSPATVDLPRHVLGRFRLESWELPGHGSHFRVTPPALEAKPPDPREESSLRKLGEWEATAISGNDILSSVLYVSGLVTASAGWLSPICLMVVAGILYIYRFIYGEAISALPMNGGAYNVLINTTSKSMASMAACLAVISYIATGVVSATTAISYLQIFVPVAGLVPCTIGLLLFFACLMVVGISESAGVALGMFLVHVLTLTSMGITSAFYAYFNMGTLRENMRQGFPAVAICGTQVQGSWVTALFFGVSRAMLGVSGFESSSQFVEEQENGVFVKTLRNMQMGVALFNPGICLLSLCVLETSEIIEHKNAMLATMAKRVGHWIGEEFSLEPSTSIKLGELFSLWVSLDAFVVLSGAVLTAYVGITGLMARMAKDRCLPQMMLAKNKYRGTYHNIIFGFFLLGSSQVLLLQGDITILAGVYTLSFLGVMTLFTLGTILLKFKRPSLPREVTVSYQAAIFGLACVMAAFMGNMLRKPEVLSWWLVYLMVVGLVIVAVFLRVRVLRIVLRLVSPICPSSVTSGLKDQIQQFQDEPFVFFCKHPDLYVINKAILYVKDNEQTNRLWVVHVGEDPESSVVKQLSKHIEVLDAMYPKIQISLLTVTGSFSPELIDWLARQLGISKNKFFITCIDAVFKYKIQELGGVRVITH